MTCVLYGITSGVYWYVVGGLGTGFYVDTDGITHGFDEVIEKDVSDIYFEDCGDVKIEITVTGVQGDINSCVGRFVYGGLGTVFDGDTDGKTLVLY